MREQQCRSSTNNKSPVQVAHSLGLPEARTFVAPPVRQVAEPSIVVNNVEPVEQWGYKVAY